MQKPLSKRVKANDLIIDPRVQRDVDPVRVRAIMKEFNINAIGTLCVSERADGTMVVIDGGHRTTVLKETGNGDVLVSAEVYRGLTLGDEAALFRLRNNTQKIGYLVRYRVRLVEGEEVAVGVKKLANYYGWGVTSDDNLPLIHGIQKLEQIFLRDEEVTAKVLETATVAWGHTPTTMDYRILGGLSMFLHRYWHDINFTELEQKLRANYPMGPDDLISKAQGIREMFNVTHASGVAELITDAYNKGKRHQGSKRLPSWRA